MREKWNKNSEPRISDGQPVPQKFVVYNEPMYKPKLLHHSPSLRAIRNYNDLPIDDRTSVGGLENPAFDSEYRYESCVTPNDSVSNDSDYKNPEYSSYDYATMGTLSLRTTTSGGSELNSSEQNEMGSTVKLVTAKVGMSCQSWCTHLATVVCTASMAASIGNLYRLPQTTLIRGGLPFLVVYIVLTVVIGLPLLFLELGIGQMAEEGFIKSWRAVPFFKGIGYVKLLAGCLLSIYYPLYMGMALFYIIWILKGSLPFKECASGVIITEDGYSPDGKGGQQCLRQTFIKSPFEDPYWFGIYAALLLLIWIIITLLSIRKTKSYIRSLLVLFFPTIAVYIALTTKSILLESKVATLHKFVEDADWTVLSSANVWYYATIQVFFSTSIGFGSFITNAGIIYNKINPLWTALGYITINIIFGAGSIIIFEIFTGKLNITINDGDIAEVQLFALIYDVGKDSSNSISKYWIMATYAFFLFSGFISMATLPYTLLKAICGHNGNRLKWWQTSIILSFSGFVLGCALLLRKDFDLVHLLDHYIVGNLILICVIIEVLALTAFYGTGRIQSDFEFMLGHLLSKVWLFLWWFIPLLLTAIFAWGLATLPLEGIYRSDPAWLYGIGWAVVLTAFVFIFVTGIYVVTRQDGYTVIVKLKASLEPSHNWGPKDPMLRHNWVQWNTKTQHGERDFTLKRKGTKDYTRTIKRNAKKAASELSSSSIPGNYQKNDTNHNNRISNGSNNYTELYYLNTNDVIIRKDGENENGSTLRVTSLVDSLERPRNHHHHHHLNRNTFPINPLAQNALTIELPDGSNSEGYGTFRKGPYVISSDNAGHVCHRKYSETTTEL